MNLQLEEYREENRLLHEQLAMLKDIMRDERAKYSKIVRLLQLQSQGVELPENILKKLNIAQQPPPPTPPMKPKGADGPGDNDLRPRCELTFCISNLIDFFFL
jgi:hypothetical protein